MADAVGPVDFDGEEGVDDGEFEVGMADLGIESGNDVLDDDDVEIGFDGVDDEQSFEEPADASADDSDSDGPSFESAINNGLGRAAVYGLPDDAEKERLNEEFTDIAEAFHVGYFGEQVAEEYLARDIEDVPPELGLAAASIAFAAVVIHRRPDGEMIVQKARWRLQDVRDGYREKTGDDEETVVDIPEAETEEPVEHPTDTTPTDG